MGGRTSLFLTSQRMPSRYKSVHMHIQLWKQKHRYECNFNNLCRNTYTQYVAATGFFIHRTEIFDFVVRWDKKVYRRQDGEWAEMFLEHIRMDEIINGFWFYISFAQRCWCVCKFDRHDIWRRNMVWYI